MPFSEVPGTEVVLGLGSNRGDSGRDSRTILEDAIVELGNSIPGLRRSSFFETEPLYVENQPRFLNAVVAGSYCGSPVELLVLVHRIEASFGRDRSRERRWGERTLDIDILLFGNLALSEPPELEIPHPRLKERRFALEPLLELRPDAVEPGSGKPYREVCRQLPDQGCRKI
jgi:2-amino-4-hydroxy-6-hydroxymethyldihydropteridine diphosphokinase